MLSAVITPTQHDQYMQTQAAVWFQAHFRQRFSLSDILYCIVFQISQLSLTYFYANLDRVSFRMSMSLPSMCDNYRAAMICCPEGHVLLPAAAATAAYRSISRYTLVMPHSSSVAAPLRAAPLCSILCAQGKIKPLFVECNCFC
jgi:hypothetical protein